MKGQFPGYFTPSNDEFTKLWRDCIFSFDANVLLGLYRSTAETQEVFFNVLARIADRTFLPHQAASEYLKHRLNVISFRSDQYGKIKNESEKLSNVIQSIVQQHAVLNGGEIAKVARKCATKIGGLADAAAAKEPDLLRSDNLLTRLAKFFETSTGEPYTAEQLKEIYAQGAKRYAEETPPGYKDDKKGEPDKYGDLLIWFQLIDLAVQKGKPIVFVSSDVKEDWLQQHRGETLGPRPELRQEMMAKSKLPFWIYTTPRFLEYASQFLSLTIDTKKAESEFEKIEKQDRQAGQEVFPLATYYANYINPTQPWLNWNAGEFHTQPVNFEFDNAVSATWTQPVKEEFLTLLPINGSVYSSTTGKWKCEMVASLDTRANDRACYSLKFEPEDRMRQPRNLKLWVSLARLESDSDWRYKKAISQAILNWLSTHQSFGEIELSS